MPPLVKLNLTRISHASEKSGLTSPGMDLQIRSLATNLEPTECVGAAGPAHSVGEEGNGQGRPFSDHFSRERERACEKYKLEGVMHETSHDEQGLRGLKAGAAAP